MSKNHSIIFGSVTEVVEETRNPSLIRRSIFSRLPKVKKGKNNLKSKELVNVHNKNNLLK